MQRIIQGGIFERTGFPEELQVLNGLLTGTMRVDDKPDIIIGITSATISLDDIGGDGFR